MAFLNATNDARVSASTSLSHFPLSGLVKTFFSINQGKSLGILMKNISYQEYFFLYAQVEVLVQQVTFDLIEH